MKKIDDKEILELLKLHENHQPEDHNFLVGYTQHIIQLLDEILQNKAEIFKDIEFAVLNNSEYNASVQSTETNTKCVFLNAGIVHFSYLIYNLIMECAIPGRSKNNLPHYDLLEIVFDFATFIATDDTYSLGKKAQYKINNNLPPEGDIHVGLTIEVFFVLHELGHIYHQHRSSIDRIRNEHEADKFAITQLLNYGKLKGIENQKFVLLAGIYTVLCFYEIVENVDSILDRKEPLKSHPASKERKAKLIEFVYGENNEPDILIQDLNRVFDYLLEISIDILPINIYTIGRMYYVNGDLLNAARFLEPLNIKKPNEPIYLHLLAKSYNRLNNLEEAKNFLNQSLKIDANNALGWYDLGNIHINQNDFISAISAYIYAIRLDNTDSRFHVNLATVYMLQGLFLKAIKELKVAESLNSKDGFLHINLASSYIQIKKMKLAKYHLTELKKLNKGEFENAINSLAQQITNSTINQSKT